LAEPVVEVFALAEPVPLLAEPVVEVFALADPDPLLAEPVVEVWALEAPDPLVVESVVPAFADDVPDEGGLVVEVVEDVVVLAWEPDEAPPAWLGVVVGDGFVVVDEVVVC